jgi:pimeloyl-ACP methyl ester carboxylesterase
MQFKSNYIQLDKVKLHYIQEGSGEKVIFFLHGWPEFWYSWRHQIPALVDAGFKVIAPDLRGFNLSDKPSGVEAYALENVGKDIAQFIDKLGIEKAHIVGHDWGGALAWHMGLHYPEKVDKLAILNSPYPAIFLKNLRSNPSQLLKSWYMLFFQIPILPEFLLKLNLSFFFKKTFRGWAYNKKAFPKEAIDAYAEAYAQKGAMKSSINYYRAGLRFSSAKKEKGRKIQSPTLMIWGENDKALSKDLTIGTEKYINNNFDLKFIPQCSHWVQQDAPDLVNEYLVEFFVV